LARGWRQTNEADSHITERNFTVWWREADDARIRGRCAPRDGQLDFSISRPDALNVDGAARIFRHPIESDPVTGSADRRSFSNRQAELDTRICNHCRVDSCAARNRNDCGRCK